jgi:hypothetical protein
MNDLALKVASRLRDAADATCRYYRGSDSITRLRAAIAAFDAARAVSGWIPVGERMPREGEKVLVAGDFYPDEVAIAAWFDFKGKPIWHQDSEHVRADSGTYGNGATLDHDELKVSHWAPLPKGPAA